MTMHLLSISYIYGVLLTFSSLMSLYFSVTLFLSDLVIFVEWNFLEFNSVSVIMTLLFDWVSLSFMSVVFLISSMVMFYSHIYMMGDKSITRFILLVFLFVLSMAFLVLSPNMISILLGWDGLGLVSYCLVIYYQNIKSANAGLLTILSNRIGDVAILLCISWMFNFGGWNFFYLPFMFSSSDTSIVLILVVLAALTKSAQIPFSAWLPAAMAAPTPVSSLVHSSTLVTAGVYLLIRFSEMLGVSFFLFYISLFTMVMSGLGANYEMDLKKIIALSTLSQLGVMMMTLSLGLVELTYFHLVSHALFKSLLFLCAGVYIHNFGDIQDIRLMGGVGVVLPITSLLFIGCSLSLCGFPFLSGFYSKDMILEQFFMGEMNSFMFLMVLLGTLATFSYSVRLVFFMFSNNLGAKSLVSIKEDLFMILPMLMLFFSSTWFGSMFSWVLLPSLILLPLFIKTLVLLLGLYISFLMWGVISGSLSELVANQFIKNKLFFFGGMWGLPVISTTVNISSLILGFNIIKFLDQGWLEELGGQGTFNKMSLNSSYLDSWSVMEVKSYLFLMFLFLLILMFIM